MGAVERTAVSPRRSLRVAARARARVESGRSRTRAFVGRVGAGRRTVGPNVVHLHGGMVLCAAARRFAADVLCVAHALGRSLDQGCRRAGAVVRDLRAGVVDVFFRSVDDRPRATHLHIRQRHFACVVQRVRIELRIAFPLVVPRDDGRSDTGCNLALSQRLRRILLVDSRVCRPRPRILCRLRAQAQYGALGGFLAPDLSIGPRHRAANLWAASPTRLRARSLPPSLAYR